ncbi:hypothetical protein DPX39_070024700 [Trypanosoma brucei equiperdum]|uniref:ER membrane protein complex subunit 7 beta-sandwich domain-containing protein n=1 Tax=Trypanosoma brucei equiperdum TaxID=630700 RepID=A0A3L6L3W3_9TRYP|nr:hypothetical protein DPX39_070024700 [Trypanosoma brucei equiperdum]
MFGRGCMLTFISTALLLLGVGDAADVKDGQGSVQTNSDNVSYYGRLKLHPTLVNNPDFHNPLWHVQGGEVILSNAQHSFRVPTQVDGSFVVHGVPYGSYYLHAEYSDHIYPTIRVDVTQKTSHGLVRPLIRTYANEAILQQLQGTGLDESAPATIPFVGIHNYFVPREEYTVWGLLTNPMIMMMLVSMALIGMMNLVPEEERRESMREFQNLRKQFSGGGADEIKQPARRAVTAAGHERKHK